jgi:hypothetical protein
VLAPYGVGQQFATTGSGRILAGQGCVVYSGAYETTGSASATVACYDGASNNGQLLFYYTLSAGQSTSEEMGPHWLPFEDGLYITTVAGSVAGTLSIYVDHLCRDWLDAAHRALALQMAEDATLLNAQYG